MKYLRSSASLAYSAMLMAFFFATLIGCDAPKPAEPAGNKTKVSQGLSPSQAAAAKEILGKDGKPSPKLTKVSLLLNWYPEAEHGGFYAAQVHGIYSKYGLDVEIRPGGKTTVVPQELILGRVQFGVANADDVLIARNQDISLVALMAPIQDGPRCILTRKESGIDSFEKLQNIKLQIDSTRPYVPFLKSKGFLTEGVEVVPYFGSVAQVVSDPKVACQGYSFSEPFMARKEGAEVNELMMSSIGYNPYASLLVATDKYIAGNDEVCQKMVMASLEGWAKYLESPDETNQVILKNNKQGLEKDALDYGVVALKKLCIPEGKEPSVLGAMTEERWNQLAETLISLKLVDSAKIQATKAFTTKFLELKKK